MKYLFLSFSFLSLLAACNNASTDNTTKKQEETVTTAPPPVTPPPTTSLPSFQISDAKGKIADLSSFKGKKVFVNLWATWCGPCRAELPSIKKLYAKTSGDKAAFIMLSLDDQFETALQFAEKTKLNMPLYYPAANLPSLFNVNGIPTTFIFDEKGELIHRQEGATDYDTPFYADLLTK